MQPSSQDLQRVFYAGGIAPTLDAVVGVFKNGVMTSAGETLPQMARPHPTVAGLMAMGFRCVPVKDESRTGVMVYITYGPVWTIESVGDNSDDTVSTWPAGSPLANLPILIPYQKGNPNGFTLPINPVGLNVDRTTNSGGRTDADGDPIGISYDIAQINRLSNKTCLRFTTIQGVSPVTLSRGYRGRINVNTFQGGAPKTWMCRGIDGTNVPQPWGFTMWKTVYEFAYDPNTWASSSAFTDTRTGKPPPDVYFNPANPLQGNGLFLIDDGPTMDFSPLGLPNAT